MKTIADLGDINNKKVLVRADFNVPLDKTDGKTITDDGRIRAALPTINKLLENGAAVILMAHLGRPKPTTDFEFDPKFTLEPVRVRLSELLGKDVVLASDTVGQDAQSKAASLGAGQVLLLENVRFNKAETSKVEEERRPFAEALAKLADCYVSDGFGVVHRAQASVYDIAKLLPAAAGELVFKEVAALSKATENPERPLTVVLGGSKVSDKLGVISNLLKLADNICIGGGMAYTFLAAQGYEIGHSLCEKDQFETALGYIKEAEERGVKLLLPIDTVIASGFPESETGEDVYEGVVESTKIPADKEGLDIGPKTVELFASEIIKSKTVVWNGPSGVFEKAAFAKGTAGIAAALADATKAGAFTIIGGGDSAAAARVLDNPKTGKKFDEATDFSHISTGGGASLEFLEGKELPGLAVLA
ncbi:MAG: phosphoglycerate kinase [Candidatus Ancillula sp.]|jgi:phosphoglycerate kinase|nr:phosphoglycerate kinase [Candidatus Ancillula sp.]